VEVQEGGKRPLKEVTGEIRAKLMTERSDRAAQAKAEEAARALQTAKDFAAEARKLGLDPKEATLARGDLLEGAGRDPNVQETLFSLAVGGTSSPLKTAGGYVILRVIEHLPAGVPPLADIKDQVGAAVKRRKAEGPATERAKALAAGAAKGEDLVALAKKEGFQAGDSGLLARSDPVPSAVPAEVLRSAFETPVGKISAPVKTARGIYLVKTQERQPPDPARFDKERAELEKQVLGQKQAEAWESWLAALRGQAKIQTASQTR
jgi:parvulin-like peptidyl-prolyl isomerase